MQDYLRDLPKINATADPQALINTLGWVPQSDAGALQLSVRQLKTQSRGRRLCHAMWPFNVMYY